MDSFLVADYMGANCFQLELGPGFTAGLALHRETNGKMCDGCPKDNNGRCPSYKVMVKARSETNSSIFKPTTATTETVRQEAARLGISIGEVRRRRASAIRDQGDAK